MAESHNTYDRKEKNMVDNNTLTKFGFVKDENCLQLNEVFQNDSYLKEVYIDIYPDNPMICSKDFELLVRTHNTSVVVSNDCTRLVLKKCDKYDTHIMNILLSSISDCYIKSAETYKEIILNVQNIYYKITILN